VSCARSCRSRPADLQCRRLQGRRTCVLRTITCVFAQHPNHHHTLRRHGDRMAGTRCATLAAAALPPDPAVQPVRKASLPAVSRCRDEVAGHLDVPPCCCSQALLYLPRAKDPPHFFFRSSMEARQGRPHSWDDEVPSTDVARHADERDDQEEHPATSPYRDTVAADLGRRAAAVTAPGRDFGETRAHRRYPAWPR
jgi:hypothetical protein